MRNYNNNKISVQKSFAFVKTKAWSTIFVYFFFFFNILNKKQFKTLKRKKIKKKTYKKRTKISRNVTISINQLQKFKLYKNKK